MQQGLTRDQCKNPMKNSSTEKKWKELINKYGTVVLQVKQKMKIANHHNWNPQQWKSDICMLNDFCTQLKWIIIHMYNHCFDALDHYI